jgi:hypothetical protein
MNLTKNEKILHWVRQNNAPAWGRWMQTEEGKEHLKNKAEVAVWARVAWTNQSIEILFDLKMRQASLLPTAATSPFWILSALKKKRDLEYTGMLSSLVEHALSESQALGWRPTAQWAKLALMVCVGKNHEYSKKILDCLKLISPEETYDAIAPSKRLLPAANDEHGEATVRWLDLVGGKAAKWTKEVWDDAFLGQWAATLSNMKVDWVEWAFKAGTDVVKLDRVLRGLERSVLNAEVSEEQLSRIEKRYQEMAHRYHGSADGPRDQSGVWRVWQESKMLKREHNITNESVVERRRNAL